MDENIGRILHKLDSIGIGDDTVVIFTSDNGGFSTTTGAPTSNLPFRGGKGWLYEGGIREPLIVRWRKIVGAGTEGWKDLQFNGCSAGTRIGSIVSGADFLPTFLDLAGMSPTSDLQLDGRSLVPLLQNSGNTDFHERPLFWHYPHYSNQG